MIYTAKLKRRKYYDADPDGREIEASAYFCTFGCFAEFCVEQDLCPGDEVVEEFPNPEAKCESCGHRPS